MRPKKQAPIYDGEPLENLKAWFNFNLPRWQLEGDDIVFNGPKEKITIGKVIVEGPSNNLILRIKGVNFYLAILTDKDRLIKDLKMNICITNKE